MNHFSFETLTEHKQHGNNTFPVALYPVSHTIKGTILPIHWHKELEFIYLESGKAEFTIDNDTFTLCSGDALFVNAGLLHSGISISQCTKYNSIVCNPVYLYNTSDASRLFVDAINTPSHQFITHYIAGKDAFHNQVLQDIIVLIQELTEKSFAYELNVKAKLLSIFTAIFRNASIKHQIHENNYIEQKKQNHLKMILEYIDQHLNQQIYLEDISAYTGLSKQYLCAFFKTMTGMTILDYVTRYRIENANILLKINTLRIADIALECGFDNLSHFNRIYKRSMGCTPSEFRAK